MDIRQILHENRDLQQFLFVRGFLLTNAEIDAQGYPFFGQWRCVQLGQYNAWTHPLTGFHHVEQDGKICFLFGHAYNPFTMQHQEVPQLERILQHYGQDDFFEYVNELTGVFVLGIIDGEKIEYLVDPSGMQSACSGIIDGKFYLSSHSQLVADICNLKMDPFVERLVQYKWYPRICGGYLPADLTPFKLMKRVVSDTIYNFDDEKITHKRFWPLAPISECGSPEEYDRCIKNAADILKKNMELVSKKWERPWISLTGGIDSNTTFAAANGVYDHFNAFSYCSAPKESIDCEAAEKIAARFNVPWARYDIPQDSESLDRYPERKAIIQHNNAHIACERENELRKRVYLQMNCPADVEVKSWVSETIRGYWHKHYGRSSMPPLSAKLYRNLYKIFITNRALAHEIDSIFGTFIREFEIDKIPIQYPTSDIHKLEVNLGSWGGLNISEMKYCFDITIIYNNRKFLETMFRVPLKDRISDKHHLDMKRYLNKDLFDMNIRVVNMTETKFRAFALNSIFTLNMLLP